MPIADGDWRIAERLGYMVQEAVEGLRKLGTKLTDDLSTEQLIAAEKHVEALVQPLEPSDIRMLISLLPEDGSSADGLNWSVLHAVEASPAWPIWDVLADDGNEWVRRLRRRLANAGIQPPTVR